MSVLRDIAYGVAGVASAPVWGMYLLKTGKWRTDWTGRFGRCDAPATRAGVPGAKRLLIHAVSVGEVNATRTLVAELAAAATDVEVVVSTTTNTGFARATALYGDRGPAGNVAAVVRFPFDFSAAVGRLLDTVRPDAVALVELEVWPNFVEACDRRGVPVAVVNGRLSERSFRGYRRFRRFIGPSFAKLAAVGAQTEAYAERFRAMGVPAERVRVLDTMKWDTAEVADAVDGADALAEAMGIDRSRPLIVAGSTGPGEERMLIDACPAEAQLMLVPRKPERFEEVARLGPMVRRTGGATRGVVDAARLFLLDTMGELRMAYSLADVCVVGRSFTGKQHGSDMMEPVALGKPTVVGPYTADFADTVEALASAGGLCVTDLPGQAAAAMLHNGALARGMVERGRAVIAARRGSTRRHVEMLLPLLTRRGVRRSL